VPAVVLSYGSNQNKTDLAIGGSLSDHERENDGADTTYVMKSFSRDDDNEFDDLVVWISPNILKNRMVMAERLP
jgi:hypothetical protein